MVPLLVLGGLNVGMGAMRAQQQAKQRQAEAQMRAAEIEASPWTGKAPSTQVSTASPNVWSEMAGGAVNTLGQMAAIQNAGLFKTAGTESPQSIPTQMGEAEKLPASLMGGKKQESLWGQLSNLSSMRA